MSLASSLAGGGTSGSGGGGTGTIIGDTGSTDNRVLRSDGTGGVTLQNSAITLDDNGALSGNLLTARNGAGSVTLVAADSGKFVNIAIGGGADTVTLPAAPTAGTWYIFDIIGTDEMTVQAQGSHVIRVGSSVSSAAGTAKSSTRGSSMHLHYAAANLWVGMISGTWTLA